MEVGESPTMEFEKSAHTIGKSKEERCASGFAGGSGKNRIS